MESLGADAVRVDLAHAHGTRWSYRHGCRCAFCTAANRENKRRWRATNPDSVRATKKRSDQAHPEAVRIRKRRYYVAHKEQHGAYQRQWRATHPDRVSEYQRRTREKHRDILAARARQRYHDDPAKALAARRQQRLLRPELHAASERNRKARIRESLGTHTAADIEAQYKRQHGLCFWRAVHADCRVQLGDDYHVDHVVPISLGGSNGPENLVLTCPKCNLVKNAQHPMDWAGILC